MKFFLPHFFWLSGTAGSLVALLSGPMGAMMAWQRMAYFGDTLAHAGLLGIGFSCLMGLSPGLGTIIVCMGVALLLRFLERQPWVAQDTLLGVLSHVVLALGIVLASQVSAVRLNLEGILFGDLLLVSKTDVLGIAGVVALVLYGIKRIWKPLLSATVSPSLAQLEGVPVEAVRTRYVIWLSVVVAMAIQVVGVLLIIALLIIPAAAARFISNSPERMARNASLLGIGSVWLGLLLSFGMDWPSGPSIVLVAALFFAICHSMSLENSDSL